MIIERKHFFIEYALRAAVRASALLAFCYCAEAEPRVPGLPSKTVGFAGIHKRPIPAAEQSTEETSTDAVEARGTVLRKLIADRVARELDAPASAKGATDDDVAHALAVVDSETDSANWEKPRMTASSSLEPEQALRLAKLVCSFMPRSSYCFVLPTGSMKPLFGDKVILLLESAPFESLQVGDIVTYRHPRMKTFVVHRLVAEDYDRFRSKGDANEYMDDVCVTRANYRQRVFGIIYSK